MRPIDADAIAHKLEGKFNQDMVRYAPTLDYKDLVPQGEWVEKTWWQKKNGKANRYTVMECSICGCHVKPRYTYNFCPNCGARMK